MKATSARNLLMMGILLSLVFTGCQRAEQTPGYNGSIQQLGLLFVQEAPQPIQWEIRHLDAPAFFKTLGRGYLALKEAGKPCVAFGNDHLYFSCFNGKTWQQETVDQDYGVGLFATLAIDGQGTAHIAYYDEVNGRLKYAQSSPEGWKIEVIDSPEPEADRSGSKFGKGGNPLIQVDLNNDPHISYFDYDNQALKYAHRLNGVWQIETIDASEGVGTTSWLALDQQGQPHVAYSHKNPKRLIYADKTPSGWQAQTVDDTAWHYPSLAIDHQGQAHIAYYDQANKRLKYARQDKTTGDFMIETLTDVENTGEFATLALDSRDQAHIAYFHRVDNSEVFYIHQQGKEWLNEKISVHDKDLVGLYTTMVLDENDHPYFAYRHSSNRQLKVIFHEGETFDDQVAFFSTRIGEITSLVVDSQDRVHILYNNDSQDELRHAFWDGKDWHFEVAQQAIDTGTDSSMVINADDLPEAVFWGLPSTKYGYLKDGTWQIEWIEEHDYGDWTGWYPSLALDRKGNPAVSFYDTPANDLKFGIRKNNQWQTEIVDSDEDVGAFTSLVYDRYWRPLIAYVDSTHQDLKLAWKDNNHWQTMVLDHVGEGEIYPSLRCTTDNQLYISYISDSGDSLKIAHWNGVQWSLGVLEQGGAYSMKTSLALDANEKPHISFYNGTQKALKYAYSDGNEWVVNKVNENGNMGMGSSLAIDSQGRAHISFQDVIDQDLMYAVSE